MKNELLLQTILTGVLLVSLSGPGYSFDRYAVANGAWNATGTWSATTGGGSGASVPVAGDNVYISEGANAYTVTIPAGYTAACSNIYMGAATNKAATLTFSAATSGLNVSGKIIIYGPSAGANRYINVNAGTMSVTGNLELGNGQTGNQANRTCRVVITSGTVTVGGNLIFNNIAGSAAGQTYIDMAGNSGTFNLAGAFTINNSSGTLAPGTGKFNFNGSSAQTIPIGVSSVVYYNLATNNTSAGGASLGAAVTTTNVTGNISVQSGTLSNGGYAVAGNGTMTFSVSNGATFLVGGSTSAFPSGFGTNTCGATGTVKYSGSGNQTVFAVASPGYGNLSLEGGGTKTAAGALDVQGNIDISSTFSAGTYTHNVAGNWTNSGTFTASTSTINFNGSSAQQTIGGSASTSFYNLTLNNTHGLSLDGVDATVNNTLTLTSGLVTTGANTIIASGTVSGASSSGYVCGKLARVYTGTGSKDFAIGKGGNYRPLSVNFTALTGTPSTVTAEQTEGALPGTAPANTVVWGTRYWTITESGSSSRTYKVTLDGTGFSPDYTVKMVKGDGSSNTAYDVTTPNYTNVTGFTGFSNFGLGQQEFATTVTPEDRAVCYGATSVELKATVAPVPDGGTVQFFIDGGTVGSPVSVNTVTGVAAYTYNPSSLGSGGHIFRADFSGYGDYLAGSSNPGNNKTLTINALPTQVTVNGAGSYCVSTTITASNGGSGTIYFQGTTSGGTSTDNPSVSEEITSSGTYYFRALSDQGCWGAEGSAAVTIDPNVNWLGTTSTDWSEPSNWCGGVPTATSDVVIPSGGNQPVIDATAECNDLTIALGASLTIGAGQSLTVNGALANNAGATGLVIASDATGTGSLIHNTGNVAATVERYVTGADYAWHLLSSPLSDQAISGDFTSGTYEFFMWDEPADLWVNQKNTTVSPTWLEANGSNNFYPGRGYLVAYDATNPTLHFQGHLNNGAVSCPLTYSGTGIYQYYNLAGNPYPSAIDWKGPGWARTSLVTSGGGYDLCIWNDEEGQYGVYNSASFSDDGTLGVSRFIPVGQGFFVEASAAGSLGMSNTLRVHNGQQFLKPARELSNVLRMKVTGDVTSYSDEIMIEFGHATANGGGGKMFSFYETAPSLCTVKGDGSYSIDFRTEPAQVTIPVSFKAGIDGTYTLTASQFETFAPTAAIILEDLQAGKTQDLMQQPGYTFAASKNDNAGRFQLHFGNVGLSESRIPHPVSVYASGNLINIVSPSGQALRGDVTVYTMLGQTVLQQPLDGSPAAKISLSGSAGYYLVRVVTNESTLTTKVFINK